MSLIFLLTLFTITQLTQASRQDLWGTFRPHALISTRAKVPNSPFFGFVYHPADSYDIRHLTTDTQDKIRASSWSRHDGRSFGDQSIEDIDANILLQTNFLKHPTENNAWVLRVSAETLNTEHDVKPISIVFYAAAGPDEVNPKTGEKDLSQADQWGTLSFSPDAPITPDGLQSDVKIQGTASSIGNAYQVVVKKPTFGSVDLSSVQAAGSDKLSSSFSGSGSRGRLRNRIDKPVFISANIENFHVSSGGIDSAEAWAVERTLQSLLKKASKLKNHSGDNSGRSRSTTFNLLDNEWEKSASTLFVQRILEVPFEIEAVFLGSEGRTAAELTSLEESLTGSNLSDRLDVLRNEFDRKFEDTYGLKRKGVSTEQVEFAKAALSNLLGGIGYFYGNSISKHTTENQNEKQPPLHILPPVGLLTATPSRSRFPRGFLWDEGFHQIIVQSWDPQLSAECLNSWFGLIQEDGWIPREQILGIEARSRFPEHVRQLMVQDPEVANPPTLLLPLRLFMLSNLTASYSEKGASCDSEAESGKCTPADQSTIQLSVDTWKNAVQYYQWLKKTQSGEIAYTYRWRGRSRNTVSHDGYPLTLASGLDDYPRASVPDNSERHVDLHSWITWASGLLSRSFHTTDEGVNLFQDDFTRLKASLLKHYGEERSEMSSFERKLFCDHKGEEKICHEGYVTILPLILGLLSPDDERVSTILDALEDPSRLRTIAGVRSLSRSDEWYRKGDDYWTGPVWMPFNFLTLAALRTKYSVEDGPYKMRAARIFSELRHDVLKNAFGVFSKTGHLWENYSPDDDGAGKSGQQFTGWSSLVLLMYADMFDGIL